MKRTSALCIVSFLACAVAQAQTPAKAPAGSTAQCHDGSFSNDGKRADACVGHKGVKAWLGPAAAAVQTQSPAVTATQVAPSTVGPSPTPATPANPERPASPAPRSLTPAPK